MSKCGVMLALALGTFGAVPIVIGPGMALKGEDRVVAQVVTGLVCLWLACKLYGKSFDEERVRDESPTSATRLAVLFGWFLLPLPCVNVMPILYGFFGCVRHPRRVWAKMATTQLVIAIILNAMSAFLFHRNIASEMAQERAWQEHVKEKGAAQEARKAQDP